MAQNALTESMTEGSRLRYFCSNISDNAIVSAKMNNKAVSGVINLVNYFRWVLSFGF